MKKIATITNAIRHLNYIKLGKELVFFSRFFCLVVLYLFFDLLRIISNIWPIRVITKPLRKPVKNLRDRLLVPFNNKGDEEISSLDLVLLAVRHLKTKKTRTIITIGGMSIGFGSVIFLLSLGYGAQKLVVSRVARLDEMKQATVSIGQASSLKLNDETITIFSDIEDVESVLPQVSVVSKVNYNNSVSDVVVYGVSRKYLEESAIKPSRGKLFEDGDTTAQAPVSATTGQVAGAEIELRTDAKMYRQFSQVKYSIYPLVWKAIYAEPSEDSEIIGYTSRVPGEQDAIEVWGQAYTNSNNAPEGLDIYGNSYSGWVKDTYPIWEKTECTPDNADCSENSYIIVRDGLQQQLKTGYITEDDLSLQRYNIVAESSKVFTEGEVVDTVRFSIPNGQWAQLYSNTTKDDEELNLFTSSSENPGYLQAQLLYGEAYSDDSGWGSVGKNSNGRNLGLWLKAKVPLWRKLDCIDCDTLYLKETDSDDQQVIASVYIKASDAKIQNMTAPPNLAGKVLGDSIDLESDSSSASATTSNNVSTVTPDASDSAVLEEDFTEISLADGSTITAQTTETGEIDWVSIASDSAGVVTDKRDVIPFTPNSKREAVVNQAMLSLLGLPEADAIGKQFSAILMLDQEFFDEEYQAESESTDFTIIGVIPGDKNPAYYLPFTDVKALGIQNYSQLKVISKNANSLADIRDNIESMGYKTVSVVDTVGKINSLFDTIRFVLTLLGLVALGVAALGMFNTLTVSLLEKTREVGLMKAIGMKSNEVQRLFLAESIVMGLSGGIFGLLFSTTAGYLLSILLSTLALSKGLGIINVVYTPLYLGLSIIGISFLVGVLTGLYPSHRATKISALNALRYE